MKHLITLMVLLFASPLFAQEYTAESKNHIVILLDTSASMEEQMTTVHQTKWEAAKNSLLDVVNQIPDNTNIGLLLFNPEDWKYDLGPVNREDLKTAIVTANITGRSGTPLGTYIKKAADRLLEERTKHLGYGNYKLIVVTDGDPTNEDYGLVDKYLPDVTSRGIVVECIGVSMVKDSILKNKVHKYMSADDPISLKSQIKETVLAEVSLEDGVDGFEDLDGISTETAQAIIGSLTTFQNHPIGEQPPSSTTSTDFSTSSLDDVVEDEGGGWGFTFLMIFLFVIGLGFVLALFNG